jgi:hypothetical protein
MLTTPETIAEAKHALNEFIRRKRHVAQLRQNRSGATFQTEGGLDTDFDTEGGLGRIRAEGQESARRYLDKSKNARPVRPVDESSPAAVEGHIQALSWLKRRGKPRFKP